MEEYIKKLLEQIRFRKAHKAIGDEIRLHIEEQISANISEGMDKETAEKKAVEDMGDPVDAGIALDKVHRPQMAFGVIIIAIVVAVIGAIANYCLAKDFFTSYSLDEAPHAYLNGGEAYIRSAILGIIVMLLLYLIDYATVAKYSKIAAIAILFSYAVMSFANYKYSVIFEIDNYAEKPGWYVLVSRIFGWSGSKLFLIVPLFAGILYKYRGQKSRAVSKAILWIIATAIISSRNQTMGFRAVAIVICMLVELTIAIKKEWIKVPKIPTLISVWSLFTVVPAGILLLIYKNMWFLHKKGLLGLWQMEPMRSWFVPDSGMRRIRELLGGISIVGSGFVSSFDGQVNVPTINYVRNSYGGDRILTDIVAVWGLLAVLGAITIVAGIIVIGFVTLSKTKNQLGMVMGSGCMMWLTVNAIYNACVAFGLIRFPNYPQSFFPFLSSRNLVASYALLGIILSIYKYKNAYSQHIDLSIHSGTEELRSLIRHK